MVCPCAYTKNLPKKCNCGYSFVPCNCPHVFGAGEFLRKNAKKSKTNRRIIYLSRPKRCGQKHRTNKCRRFGRNIEIIRQPKISTRLEQLAIRPVRALLSTREQYKHFISRSWYERFNRNIFKSMFTLYSRLGNIQLPEDEQKVRKWTKEEWERHAKWLDSRACAKPLIKCDPKPRQWRPLKKLEKRLKTLAEPKTYPVLVKILDFDSALTKISVAAKEYMATDRICSLSRPKDPQSKYKQEPFRDIPVQSSKDIPGEEKTGIFSQNRAKLD